MMTRLQAVEKVRARIRVRHFALSTEDAYCHWVGRYYDFLQRRTPKANETSEERAEAFLTYLANRCVSAKTQNQALSALLFLYRDVLKNPLGNIDALRAKQPTRERVAPSREQVRAFRSKVIDTPHTPGRLLVDLLYGCGLRVSEPIELRIRDILWSEGQLVLHGAKGMKDRRVPIPASCAEPLRRQMERARSVWEADQNIQPRTGVPLPGRLGYKYPNAAYAWDWFGVFPAPNHCCDPLTGDTVRFHLLSDSLQRVVHAASVAAGFGYLISPHVLRHAYATHSREPIERLRQLMGHNSIETTAGYRHAAVEGASNPLDDLLAEPVLAKSETASPGRFQPEEPAEQGLKQATGPDATSALTGIPVDNKVALDAQRIRWKGRPLFRLTNSGAAKPETQP